LRGDPAQALLGRTYREKRLHDRSYTPSDLLPLLGGQIVARRAQRLDLRRISLDAGHTLHVLLAQALDGAGVVGARGDRVRATSEALEPRANEEPGSLAEQRDDDRHPGGEGDRKGRRAQGEDHVVLVDQRRADVPLVTSRIDFHVFS
jgi:hypothetical protein